MAKKSYFELLRDPRWQRKRLEIMKRAEFACEMCGAKDKTLNVHHRIYRKGAAPWEYDNRELECLCEDCHAKVTDIHDNLKAAIAILDSGRLEELLGYAEALAAKEDCTERVLIRSAEHAEGVSAAFYGEDAEDAMELMDEENTVSLETLWLLRDKRRGAPVNPDDLRPTNAGP